MLHEVINRPAPSPVHFQCCCWHLVQGVAGDINFSRRPSTHVNPRICWETLLPLLCTPINTGQFCFKSNNKSPISLLISDILGDTFLISDRSQLFPHNKFDSRVGCDQVMQTIQLSGGKYTILITFQQNWHLYIPKSIIHYVKGLYSPCCFPL